MRVVGEIPHPGCKITIFAWNDRYLIKVERGLLEQTYKVNAYDVTDEEELKKIIDPIFLDEAIRRFESMEHSLLSALERA